MSIPVLRLRGPDGQMHPIPAIQGEKGEPGVYYGSGDPPENYDIQVDPEGDDFYLSGCVFPKIDISYTAEVSISANALNIIEELTGSISIILDDGPDGYDNEWAFIIAQGETAYDVVLPTIEWFGDAPAFDANSTTECRLFYVGDVLKGVAV